MHSWLFALLAFAAISSTRAELSLGTFRELGQLPTGALAWEREISLEDRTIRVSGVTFNDKNATFRVLDNPPDARKPLATLLSANGAFAGANASYFHEDFRPLGLVVIEGKAIHGFERAKLLSGVLAVRKAGIELVRASSFQQGADVREAIQAGPWLVENNTPVAGLENGRLYRRTAVATDGRNRWALITLTPVTLADAARILSLKDLPGSWTIADALNLDGGGSTSLLALDGGRTLFDIPSFGPVRNYLAIVPRQR